MKKIALAGNPNCGKTTLFNCLTGSSAHVGNWPGVTVDKKEGFYKKLEEKIQIIDLPGIYSLSPYTPEEIIARNYLLDEKPDAIINIIDATNLERNLYLTTQLMEIDVPLIIALNMSDILQKLNKSIDVNQLKKTLGVPVISISALKEENIDLLMQTAYEESLKKRNGRTILNNSQIFSLIDNIKTKYELKEMSDSLFHAIKLIEGDEIEEKKNKDLIETINEFKRKFNDELFGNDLEAIVADERYKFISNHCMKSMKNIAKVSTENTNETLSDKIDKIMTNKYLGIPIFLAILAIIFHLVFSEDLLFLNAFGAINIVSFPGTMYEGLFANGGIASIGVVIFNFFDMSFSFVIDLVSQWMTSLSVSPWAIGLVCDGILSGLFAVIGFLPQILLLFLAFSILEDTGYMARIAFILDRIFRKFGLSGRAFMPMIMGFGCSVPAMFNTRTLLDQNERTATIRVIPFFSCGAKLPILTAIAGGISLTFGFMYPDVITLSMYVLGMVTAIVAILIMRNTTMRGETAPFIMELPPYHLPQLKSLVIHLWDKTKHFIKKAFTIILFSTIAVWILSHFSFDWKYLNDSNLDQSILSGFSKLFQPLFTPLGFGSQLSGAGWIFVAAAVSGLIAKENVVSIFAVLAAVIVGQTEVSDPEAIKILIENTNITLQGLISFIAFNMLTIPCFAAVATAKAELPKGKLIWTILFWITTSYIVSTIIYVSGTWLWSIPIFIAVIIGFFCLLIFLSQKKNY